MPPVKPTQETANPMVLRRNQPCPCNSGLRFKDCCAKSIIEEVKRSLQKARIIYRQGDAVNAEKIALEILKRVPDQADALMFLATLQQETGKVDKAIRLQRRLAELRPKDDDLFCDLAGNLYKKKNLGEAEKFARQAVALNPGNAKAHNLVGMILADSHKYEEAELYYREVLKLHVPVAGLCANLAGMKVKLGKLDEAEFLYRETMRLEPDNIAGLLDWIRLKESRRDMNGAWELMSRAMQLKPEHLPCYLVEATLFRREKRFEQALSSLERAAKILGNEHDPGVAYLDQRGNVLDKLGRFDEAFAAYSEANDRICRHKKLTYPQEKVSNDVANLKRFFVRERLQQLPKVDEDPDRNEHRAAPIFIIGFPRSGTTLVEQILSVLPSISAADELPYIWRLSRLIQGTMQSRQPYPDCLGDVEKLAGDNLLNKFRSYYLVNVESRGLVERGARYFTDKMPLNETNLGLINLLFPSAPIIHLVRHPLDVVLSTFFNDLTHGSFCSYRLETAAHHYALIFGLLQHYREHLDIRYLPLRYEELVASPEGHVRNLLEFIGEPWDDRCLDFHRSKRVARTASYAQVTEAVHTRSVYRFRNYRKHLEPIIPILRPAIEKLGYPLD